MIFSIASIKSATVTYLRSDLIANIPASVHIAFKSAPEQPSVKVDSKSKSASLSRFIFEVWILKISRLPSSLGSGTSINLSNLPGLKSAGSNISGLFVAPIIPISPRDSKPSSSASSCIKVLCTSLSPLVELFSLLAATASISSIKIIAGAFSFASSNTSRTSLAPSPIYFLTNSDATILIKVALVCLATAFASNVLPVPGGPYNSIPLGGSIPISLNNSGFVRGNSTVSLTSTIWSSKPPISS